MGGVDKLDQRHSVELIFQLGMVHESRQHSSTRQFDLVAPTAQADALFSQTQAGQVWIVPAMQSKAAEQTFDPV